MASLGRVAIVTLAVALAMVVAKPVHAETKLVKKIDNFVILVDQSGSMAQTNPEFKQRKIDLAMESIGRLDKAIPELDYTGAFYLASPNKPLSAPAPYKNGMLTDAAAGANTDFHVFGRLTYLGEGLEAVDPVLHGLKGKTALIVLTDGDNNYGSDPVAEAQSIYAKHGGNVCIHVVSFADNAHGKQVVGGMRALSDCTVAADAKALSSDAGAAQFAKDIFYEEVTVQPPPPPKKAEPKPAPPPPAPVAKEVITFSLNFGFDKYKITDEMIPILEEAKLILEEDPEATFTIAGHTDSTGPEAYNQGLSERRAASVKNWLVENGIAASRLDATGYGETKPKYDNSTKEGRKLNRRVEIETK